MKPSLFLVGLVLFTGAKLAHAEVDAGVFDQFLNKDECVDMQKIAEVSTVTRLDDSQFQFVRAFYAAIPPVSRSLPIGGAAYEAESDGKTLLFLEDDGKACARFIVPDFVQHMLDQIAAGYVGHSGAPL